jgi:NADH:ubiquinone oxidoreductase subunit C
MHADERYMIYADRLFAFNNKKWDKCNLTTSFRITNTMAEFVNKCVLKYDRISSTKVSSFKPRYLICNAYTYPINEIEYYLKMGYKSDEIFILAYSLKNKKYNKESPICKLENLIKARHPEILVYVPSSDDEKINAEVIKNKLVFSTFHQSKGLERKVVIVFGFDDSYFKYFDRNARKDMCPNTLYVAITRAKEHLTLIHNAVCDFLPFMCKEKIREYSELIGKIGNIGQNDIKNEQDVQVTDLVKFLPTEVIDNCIKYLNINVKNEPEEKIEIQNKIKSDTDMCEEVSEINGIAIPSYFEYSIKKNMTILDWCIEPNIENDVLLTFWKKHYDDLSHIKCDNSVKRNLLYISTIYASLRSGYSFKSYQIKNYDWISNAVLKKCIDRMNTLKITSSSQFEKQYILSSNRNIPEILNKNIYGRADCVDGKTMYEFKCVEKLKSEHYLQLAIYMYIDMIHRHAENISSHENDYHYILFNVLTNETIEIRCELDKLRKMIEYLFYNKYVLQLNINDEEFIPKMIKVAKKYYNMIPPDKETMKNIINSVDEQFITDKFCMMFCCKKFCDKLLKKNRRCLVASKYYIKSKLVRDI